MRFLRLRAGRQNTLPNRTGGRLPRSVGPDVVLLGSTNHQHKHDDRSRKTDEDDRRKQHLSQNSSELSRRRRGVFFQRATALRADGHPFADIAAAVRTGRANQPHGHVLGPVQNARAARQRESAAARIRGDREVREIVVGRGCPARGIFWNRSDRIRGSNHTAAARAGSFRARIIMRLEDGIAFRTVKH